MLKKSITFSLTLFLSVLFIFFALPASIACAMEEGEVVGTVPRLLIATSDQNALYEECTLGNALADAMVIYTGADMAVINGGMLTGNLLHGDVTRANIAECIAEDCVLAVANVNAQQLYAVLENAVSHVVIDDSRCYIPEKSKHEAFPQISGFRIAYDPSAPYGDRVARVTFNNEPIDVNDTETTYTLVSTVNFFDGEYGTPKIENYTVLEDTLYSVFESYIRDGMEDKYEIVEKRVYAMGVNSSQNSKRYTIFTVIGILLILFVLIPKPWKRRSADSFEDTINNSESEEIQ